MKKGMVYLVGAGPGDPELLTLKGKRLLQNAEVLVYDRLASPEFLKLVPDTCEVVYVGKEPGHHSMKQEEINQILVKYGLEGKQIVRLKGGDPFVFGRGGEEILELEKYGIPYEVVPGITSAIAALSHAGIPVTHRGISQSFHVITGHTAVNLHHDPKQNQTGSEVTSQALYCSDTQTDGAMAPAKRVGVTESTLTDGFAEYAKLNGTLIFLMGLSNLEEIVDSLIQNGKAPDTPAAVVTSGTLPEMRVVRAKLCELVTHVRAARLKNPGIIVVGPVADFSMTTRNNLPLAGIQIGITGTDSIYEKLSPKLYAQGAGISRVGISTLVPMNRPMLQCTVQKLQTYDWIVFTSRNAIRLFFDAVKSERVDFRSFSCIRFAVVGSGTGEYLETYGFHADYMPEMYTTEALANGLVHVIKSNETILIPRAKQGSKILTDTFDRAGFRYDDLAIYDISVEPVTHVALSGLDYITFESSSGVRGFFQSEPEFKRQLLNESVQPVCIGHVTADVLKSFGVNRALVARDYTADGICELLCSEVKTVSNN